MRDNADIEQKVLSIIIAEPNLFYQYSEFIEYSFVYNSNKEKK